MTTKAVSLFAPAVALAMLLGGCATTEPGTTTSSTPGAVATTPTGTAPTGQAPTSALPTTTPPAPATAEAHEAPPAWDACVSAIRQQYPDLPTLDDVWAYEDDDVRDSDTGAVVEVRLGHLDDGRVASAFVCQISGTPEAPVVDSVSPVDI
ncbi:hypothetical protein ACPEEZ_04215 [Frigoribacterium sp. 2-23]|uniref:hypothetical protein n=1 Tax=Frigoribacterium sp. 2-23 TaxID=3415006 RepID=UPI003C6F6320